MKKMFIAIVFISSFVFVAEGRIEQKGETCGLLKKVNANPQSNIYEFADTCTLSYVECKNN